MSENSSSFRNAQFAMKALAASICAIVAAYPMPAQERPAGGGGNSPRIYYWKPNDLGGFDRWRESNRALLEKGDSCSIGYYWTDDKTKVSSSNLGLAEFVVTPEDENVSYMIREPESGIDVKVGVKYHVESPKQSEILVVLAFEGSPEEVFDEISRAEARTGRDSKWKFLEVKKPIIAGDRRYGFYLVCENGKTAFSLFKKRK